MFTDRTELTDSTKQMPNISENMTHLASIGLNAKKTTKLKPKINLKPIKLKPIQLKTVGEYVSTSSYSIGNRTNLTNLTSIQSKSVIIKKNSSTSTIQIKKITRKTTLKSKIKTKYVIKKTTRKITKSKYANKKPTLRSNLRKEPFNKEHLDSNEYNYETKIKINEKNDANKQNFVSRLIFFIILTWLLISFCIVWFLKQKIIDFVIFIIKNFLYHTFFK